MDAHETRLTSKRLGAGTVAVLVTVGVLVWLLAACSSPPLAGSSGSSGATTAQTETVTTLEPVALGATGLRAMVKRLGQPVYWAGPVRGQQYELRRTASGYVYVRYLPHGVKAGVSGSKYLIVATYPYPDAIRALKAVARGKSIKLSGGGIAFVRPGDPKSVLLAFPNVPYQIEVYDPRPSVSRAIAVSGRVRPVG